VLTLFVFCLTESTTQYPEESEFKSYRGQTLNGLRHGQGVLVSMFKNAPFFSDFLEI